MSKEFTFMRPEIDREKINNPIHLLEFHKFELAKDFKTASSIFSNQNGEATGKDWNKLLDKFIDIDI